MATYTPRFNLSKPENTDSQQSFIEDYCQNMEIIDDNLGGGGSANIVSLTQAEYDALPSSKESDNVLYLAYFDGGQTLDPDYNYHKHGDNDEIIVRVYHEGQSDQQTLWFFRGWNQTGTIISVPSELSAYAPTVANQAVASKNFTDNTGATQNGWIGFYSGTIRAWSQNWASNITGIMYGVVDPNGSYYPNPQTNSYIDDPYVYIQDGTATRRIYMNGREYAEFNGGGSSYTAGDGIDITSNVISLEYLKVVNGAVNLVFDDGN